MGGHSWRWDWGPRRCGASCRPALLAGVVPEPSGQGEEAEEGRGEAAVGAILQEHEALPGGLQIRQGQHPGGGSRQRRRGLLHRSVPDGALLSSSPSFIYPDGSFRLEYVKAGSPGGRGGLGGEVLSSGAGGIAGCRTRPHGGCLRFGECSRLPLGCPSCPPHGLSEGLLGIQIPEPRSTELKHQ